jgi:Sigma-70 region 2
MVRMFAAAPTASSAVTLALDGDEAAFRWIVETHISGMTQVCFVVCGDREIADEAVAASWPIAWQKLSSLRDPASLRAWLVTIAANQARRSPAAAGFGRFGRSRSRTPRPQRRRSIARRRWTSPTPSIASNPPIGPSWLSATWRA